MSHPVSTPPKGDVDDAQLLATKSQLFGSKRANKTDANSTTNEDTHTVDDDSPLGSDSATARLRAEAEASLAELESDLGGGDYGDGTDGGNPLDLTTTNSSEIDFDGLGGDLKLFEQHELVREALEKEKDLRNYSRDIEKELAEYEQKCVEDYIVDSESLSSLHVEIQRCDGILSTMESMLTHFQSDLAAISSEIQFLQEKSYGMNIKLRNYKSAEKSLNAFIQSIYIPDDLCNLILEGELTEAWVEGIKELDKKLIYLDSHRHDAGFALAVKDMAPIGEKLKLKSIARIRAFLLERFHSLKKPKTNIQIKQKALLKFAYFYQFLLHHAGDERSTNGSSSRNLLASSHSHSHSSSFSTLPPPHPHPSPLASQSSITSSSSSSDLCSDLRKEYHETMSVIYASKLKKYLTELKKLQLDEKVRKEDTIGSDVDSSSGSNKSSGSSSSSGGVSGLFSSMFSSMSRSSSNIDAVFRLNGREAVLLGSGSNNSSGIDPDNPLTGINDRDLIIPHLLGATGGGGGSGSGSGSGQGHSGGQPLKMPFEKLFRSAESLLMDAATSEYDFIVEFFGERMQRDMDRAGMYEDELASEREREEKEKETETETKKTSSYEPSPLDERGRENLLPHSRDKHLFNLVFNKTIQLFVNFLEEFLFSTYDALGILLVIRIVCQHNIQMQYRRVHCLDAVFDRMNMLLWPKFKNIFDENVASIMKLQPIEIRIGAKVKPHVVGTRYAEFAAGVLLLNEGYDDDILVANLKRLRGEVDKFFIRSADRIPPQHTKVRLVFLLTNYHSILSILASHNQSDSDDAKYWRDQVGIETSRIVEEELIEVFPSLVEFIRTMTEEETRAKRENRAVQLNGRLGFDRFKQVVQQFNSNWKEGIEKFHNDIRKQFEHDQDGQSKGGQSSSSSSSSSSLGSSRDQLDDIFMRTLTQLMLYCETLDKMLKESYRPIIQQSEYQQVNQLLVPPRLITIEVKNSKYRK